MNTLLIAIVVIVLIFLFIELIHSLRCNSPLKLILTGHNISKGQGKLEADIYFRIVNYNSKVEVMVENLKADIESLRSKGSEINLNISHAIVNLKEHSKYYNYWNSTIVKSHEPLSVKLHLRIESNHENDISTAIEGLWINIYWLNYGPFGRQSKSTGFVLPINKHKLKISDKEQSKYQNNIIQPIKTHILGVLDDPYDVLKYYLPNDFKKTNTLTIGETPLAIMQGRYFNPSELDIEFISKILCKPFHPTSSLATACGMQSLVNIVGPSRVIIALLFGSIAKLIGIKGIFYRLAGDQARLIDDITGTTAPYDKSIVLGPKDSKILCEEASQVLGLNIAVVDVNDLGRVKIIAASSGTDISNLKRSLISNPAGNADQQTPIVFIKT